MAGFQISISAVDNATKTLDAINKKMAALRAPAEAFNKSLSKFGNVSGITNSFNKIHAAASKSFGVLSKFAPALGAITAGGLAVGLANIVRTWAEFSQQLQISSITLGMLPSKLMLMQNAMRLVGGSAEGANKAYETLQDTLRDASLGKNIDAYRLLTASHIKWLDELGKPLPVDKVAPQIYDAIHAFQGTDAAARKYAATLGVVDQAQYALARSKGNQGFLDAQHDAANHGGLTDPEIKKLADVNKLFTGLRESAENFTSHLAIKMAPAIERIITKLTTWMDSSDQLDKTIQWIKRHIDALLYTFEALFAFMAARFAIVMLMPFIQLGILLVKAIGWIGNLTGATELLAQAFSKTLVASITMAEDALIAFNARMALNPTMKMLMLALQLYESMKEGTPTDAMSKDSPLWRVVPKEDQLKYPNSPESLKLHPEGEVKKPATGINAWIKRQLGIDDSDAKPSAATPAPSASAPGPQSSYVPGDKASFIAAMSGKAQEESAKTGVDARIILAQAGLESGWGAHAPNNNLFGIKGPGGTQSTKEFVDGKMVDTTASFKGYSNPNASFDGYADFINANPRYQGMKSANGIDAQLDELRKSGYATDPDYQNKVGGIAKSINIDKPAPVDGNITIDVNHNNAPPGSSVTATTSGGYLGTPKVVTPMTGYS